MKPITITVVFQKVSNFLFEYARHLTKLSPIQVVRKKSGKFPKPVHLKETGGERKNIKIKK